MPRGQLALLVGVDRYPLLPPANQLRSCANDARLMAHVLRERFGTEAARVISRAMVTTVNEIERNLVEDEIDAQWFRGGALRLARGEYQQSSVEGDYRTLEALGLADGYELLDAAQTVERLAALPQELDGKGTKRARSAQDRPIAGTRLVREWKGVEHSVTVRDDGYEYQGRPYKSLSAIARLITGTRWNGWTFFGLKNQRTRS